MTRRDHAKRPSGSQDDHDLPNSHDVPVDREMERETDQAELLASLKRRAAHLQHAMNNPLAALLAEGQLLKMENTLTAEQVESVDRMIELTRRVIAQVRKLDELRGINPPR